MTREAIYIVLYAQKLPRSFNNCHASYHGGGSWEIPKIFHYFPDVYGNYRHAMYVFVVPRLLHSYSTLGYIQKAQEIVLMYLLLSN